MWAPAGRSGKGRGKGVSKKDGLPQLRGKAHRGGPQHEIDWSIFGLDLDAPLAGPQLRAANLAPLGQTPPSANGGESRWSAPSAPSGPRPNMASPRRPAGLKLRGVVGPAMPADASALSNTEVDQVQLTYLKSSTIRARGYVRGLPSLTQLLADRGVDFSRPNPDRDVSLPLEPFVDSTMCTRTPEEWQEVIREATQPLKCLALNQINDADGDGRWEEGLVLDWISERRSFHIRWLTGAEDLVMDLLVYFQGDDPVLFADRLAAAIRLRRYAQSLLKYHHFVDSMPEDKTRRIGRESAIRIAEMAKANRYDPNDEWAELIDKKLEELVEEAQGEYMRVQNLSTFDKVMSQGGLKSLPVELQLPPPVLPPQAPYCAVRSLPRGPRDANMPLDFREGFEWFCQASLYIRSEVCMALQVTNDLCLDVLTEQVLDTSFQKPMRLQEFVDRQEAAVKRARSRLNMWVNTIRMRITHCLQQATVKWYDLNDSSIDSYKSSRMRQLLVCVKLIMSNALCLLGSSTLNGFVEAIESLVPVRLDLPIDEREVLTQVINVMGDARYPRGERWLEPAFKPTLFRIDTLVGKLQEPARGVAFGERMPSKEKRSGSKRGGSKRTGTKRAGSKQQQLQQPEDMSLFIMGTKLSDCKAAAQFAFSRGMQIFHEVYSVESVLLPHLIREDKLQPNFTDSDPWIRELIQRLDAAFDSHERWLQAILKAMEIYKDVVELDPDAAVKRLRAESTPMAPVAVKQMIEEHQKRRKELIAEIPDDREAVPVGLYLLDTSSVRSQLCEKLDMAEALLMQYLSDRLDDEITAATEQFADTFARLRQEINTIEEAAAMTDFIKSIPGELSKMQGQVNDAMHLTELLEALRYALPIGTLDARWRMFGAPGDVVREMLRVEHEIEVKTRDFQSKQEVEQKEFESRLRQLEVKIDGFVYYRDIAQVMEVAEEVRKTNEEIRLCQETVRLFNSREALFGKDQTDYSQLSAMVKRFEPYSNLWKTAGDWMTNKDAWLHGRFDDIDARYCESEVTNGSRLLFKTIRTLKEDDELRSIVAIAEQIKVELDEFKPYLPLVMALRTDGMRERHWHQISDRCGETVGPSMPSFTLSSLLQAGVLNQLPIVQEVGDCASKEYQLEKALSKMKADWEPLNFDVTEKYRRTGTYILKGDGEAMVLLDEHIVTTQAMMFSLFKGPFEEEINEWNQRLLRVSETLEEWLKCQKSWMYLQPIFDSDDISRQLPTESKRFKSVDTVWRREMESARENPKIIEICATEGLLEKWREQNIYLDMVQKGLEDYLETKRTGFARFYFLSNDELLEILSQTKDPTRVQPFLSKVFEAMSKVNFAPDGEITDMISPEGEIVTFPFGVVTYQRQVEAWMCDLEEQMREAIRAALHTAIVTYSQTVRTEWVLQHPAQAVLNGSQVQWTAEVEQAFVNGVIPQYAEQLSQQINGLVMLFRTGLTKTQRTLVGALVVIDVHAKDIIHSFAEEGITNRDAFEWISQLRYYWEVDDRDDDNLWVRCVQTSFPYGYEYLGNSMRLVITPLTDLCYITLMGAQALSLGGAPAGPAGTGKTETTKDLAKALAKQCVVFNCSPEMDYIMVGKFFKGLAFSGAWCCFDEFNRINIEVLSVIAQQLLVLFGKKAEMKSYNDKADLEFEGTLIVMRPTFNVFITMNPGYAGRAELPDNLAALFRPVAMMVPDYALIGQIMFYAYGFSDAQSLAKKMVTTFTLSSEQLSSQCHYDYGMRAVKSTIEMCGKLKRELGDTYGEDQITLRALRDVNVPKFLKDDLPLFENIITDLFPTTKRGEVEYGNLMPVLEQVGKKQNLQLTDNFVTKVVQLIDTIGVRHGLMLVGPTGGGKTSNWRLLQATSTMLHVEGDASYQKVQTHVLNPKAITQAQLYGAFDEVTREWSDGVASECVRTAVASGKSGCPDNHWVIFDGPVDALWIESMNTVLDDNKKLCLTSGEIIALTPQMRMVFEVEDLSVASPATVSRCGMVYMEPSALGNEPLVESWLTTLPDACKPEQRASLQKLMLDITLPMISVVRKRTKELSATVDNNLCLSQFRLLDCYFEDFIPTEAKQITPDDVARLASNINPLFFFTLVWSVGATCDNRGRKVFSNALWQQVIATDVQVGGSPSLETGDMWYDYVFQLPTGGTGPGQWMKWSDFAPRYTVPPKAEYQDIVVPTVDSVRLMHTVSTYLLRMRHVIVAGNTGTGKSAYVSLWLQKEAPEKYLPIFINFSAQTHVNQLQDLLDSKFEKRRRGVYGPPAGQKNIIFVDDLNMPKKEFYGAQPPIELLRQWHDYHGWYNRKELKMQEIIDVAHISAMGPPGGGRTEISGRLKRHYCTVVAADLAHESVANIFVTILGHFLSQGFDPNIQALRTKVVDCSIKIFEKVSEELLPTPAKSHYGFNLRDIWKVFQGICSLKAKKVTDAMTVIRCYCHENIRVYGDRLINQQDRRWLQGALEVTLIETFGVRHDEVFDKERLLFADFLGSLDSRYYLEVADLQALKKSVEMALDDYNNEFPVTMPLVMFMDACEHVARICRVLRQPSGNALLLGVGGSGRQSLSRLATYISDFECFQIEVVKGYGMPEFKEDMKGCLMKCGNELKMHSFLFADTQIVNDQMVEMINNILNTGDVPNLYKSEDTDAITMACRGACQQAGLQPTKANVFSVYLSRVKAYLHVVLAFSPVGDAFRTRLRMFPSLVNCCTIDWFAEWPAEALYSVGKQQMTTEDLKLPNLEGILKLFSIVHQSVETGATDVRESAKRAIYITPTSFLELIATFKKVLGARRSVVGTLQGRLQKGLDALEAASYAVTNMEKDIKAKQPVLEQTKKEVADMMVVITDDKAKADITREECQKVEAEAKAQADSASAIKEDAQKDLAEALPALDVANKSLKALKLSSLQEIRALTNPPAGVRLTLEAICVMFGIKPVKKTIDMKKVDDYWEASQKGPLADPKKLLDDLFEYDKDNIPDHIIQRIQPYIDREDFDPAAIKKASVACEALCMWCRAMHKYHYVALAVEPKRKLLAEAEASLETTMGRLHAAQAELKTVEDKIAQLEADYNNSVTKQDNLTREMEICSLKLVNATKLLDGLGGENERWMVEVTNLGKQYDHLPGDSLVAAGMVAYAGPFTEEYRLQFADHWRHSAIASNVLHSLNCNLVSVLGQPVTIQQWSVNGLPHDNLSVENGIIIATARRWPLMIDPQRQANKYIKQYGKAVSEAGLTTVKLSDHNLLQSVELGVQFGKWVLLENVGEKLDPALEPVLQQQKVRDGSMWIIKLGDKVVSYDMRFRFFLTTTLSNPHYSPETSVKVTLLNFAITPEGLQDQMLGIVVQKEQPEMEEKKQELLKSNAEMTKQLKDIEDEILRLLSAEGDILESKELIDTLEHSKKTSAVINKAMEEAKVTEVEIDKVRKSYRDYAFRASLLFFSVSDLQVIDPMYQYSLQWFQSLARMGIDNSPPGETQEARLQNLIDYFTYSIYQSVCRGLFENHKLLFSFSLALKIMSGDGRLIQDEVRFLLAGPTGEVKEPKENPAPHWLSEKSWNEVQALGQLEAFAGFPESFDDSINDFQRLYDHPETDTLPMPGKWDTSLTPMQKMCFLRSVRPDRLTTAVLNFVKGELGQRFVEPPTFDIAVSYEDSTKESPLIFLLSPGSDPVADMLAFADSQGMSSKLESISLGQGQGPKAKRLIEQAREQGAWVLLCNCHLSVSWLPELEQICEQMNPDESHDNFRLWLTSMPTKEFPSLLLQNGVKMTNEPPKGLRANVLSSMMKCDDRVLNDCEKPETFARLNFGFCFFHAVCQDRRKFGPIGWNIPYNFTPEDLVTNRRQLKYFLDNYDEVPYKVLQFLGAKINYGGRVTDAIDKRLIECIIKIFICEDVVTKGPEYHFSKGGFFYCPAASTQEEFLEYLRGLPLTTPPEVFGLHDNCEITCAEREALQLLQDCMTVTSGSGGNAAGGKSSEVVMFEMAGELIDLTPDILDLDAIEASYPTKYEESRNTVLKQEAAKYNKLLDILKVQLPLFRRAINGFVAMTEDLEALGRGLFLNTVPTTWTEVSFLSLKPLTAWFKDLNARVQFIKRWQVEGHPTAFWISGLYFPQAFFTAILQNFARKSKHAIDRVNFDIQVRDDCLLDGSDISEPPPVGCYMYGLHLEGCRWNDEIHCLDVSLPKELFAPFPVVLFKPELDWKPKPGRYTCPIYKVLSRKGTLSTTGHSTNFVRHMGVPSTQEPDVWIRAGVAAFLALRY